MWVVGVQIVTAVFWQCVIQSFMGGDLICLAGESKLSIDDYMPRLRVDVGVAIK